MEKAIHSDKQRELQRLLREARKKAGLTQAELGERLAEPQSLVSDYERGERRLDLIELRQVCEATEITLEDFVARFERAIRDR